MNLNQITPLILTFNESANLKSTLSQLKWASQIVVVDSNSTDETVGIASAFQNTSVVLRDFDNHTDQWNFGLEQVQTDWVLALDADYICPSKLREELSQLDPKKEIYFANFRYCIFGSPLRASLYPPRAVLFQQDCRYIADGHTQTLDIDNRTTDFLESAIDHDDRKPILRWCKSQISYAKLESNKLLDSNSTSLGWKDRIRKRIVFAPLLTIFYCLFARGLIFNGWRGVFYTFQRTFAELLLSLILLDSKLRRSS